MLPSLEETICGDTEWKFTPGTYRGKAGRCPDHYQDHFSALPLNIDLLVQCGIRSDRRIGNGINSPSSLSFDGCRLPL
jgi:hypothetical protein